MATKYEVVNRLREAIASAGGQRAFAERYGFSAAYVNDVLHGRRELAPRILSVLGFERVVSRHVWYEEKP